MNRYAKFFAGAAAFALFVGAAHAEAPVNLIFATQGVGTAPYSYAKALQYVMTKALPKGSEIFITTSSAGGVSSPQLIQGEDCDITLSNSAPAKWSKAGEIANRPATPDVAALAGGIGKDFVNVMFTKAFVDKTGISTLEELVAKKYPVRIGIKREGTLGELTAEKVFEALGAKLDDVVEWGGVVDRTSPFAIKQGLQVDEFDLTIDHVGSGQRHTAELAFTHEMVYVQLADETLAKLVELGYDYVTMDANTWFAQTEEIKTVGSQQCVIVSTKMSDDLAYTLTKAICEGADELGERATAMYNFDPETACQETMTGVELHPGAKKYYVEKGYITE